MNSEYIQKDIEGTIYEWFPSTRAICAGPASENGGPYEDEDGNWIGGSIARRDDLPPEIQHWWDWK